MTVLNEEKTIKDLIDSILRQSYLPDEVVVVDGGSQDKTISNLKLQISNSKHSNRFKIFIKEGNRSIGRNFAIKNSKGELIAITDAGCVLDKNWFKNITKPFVNKNIDVVGGYYKAKPKNIFQKCLVPYVLVMPDKIDPEDFLPATRSMAIRKSSWKKAGGFDERLSHNEDYAFVKKLKKIGEKFKFEKSAVVYWIPRSNLFQTFKMFYRFALGDIEAGIIRPKVVFIFLRYIIALLFIFVVIKSHSIFILYSIFFILFAYITWAIFKNYKYIRDKSAIFYLPLLQFTSDIAVILGTSVGFISKSPYVLPIYIFLYFSFLGINLPYVGQNAYNFNTYSIIAHNYNQFGFLATKFASVISVSKYIPKNPEYFIHHPPLLSIVESFFLKILGEEFWVGRLVMILFILGAMITTYLIGYEVKSKKYAFFSILALSIIPATAIFGKMIGQESLVIFFMMLTSFFSIKYLKKNNLTYYAASVIAVVLGTLSDWPMVYFTIFLLPLFIKYKKIKYGVILSVASIVAAALSVIWIAWIRSGFWDLHNAVSSRNFLALSDISFWPIFWIASTMLRLIIYFNPLILIMSAIALFRIFRKIRLNNLTDVDILIIIFFCFGLFHILLYTEASFTHPYLLIYFLPFISLSAGLTFLDLNLRKRYFLLSLILAFSLIYLIILTNAKNAQIESNIWRYQLAEKARSYLSTYETIIYNKYYAIDPDIWVFPLLINPKIVDENETPNFLSRYKHYIYSCEKTCDIYRDGVNLLKKRYKYVRIQADNSEAYVFFLQTPQSNKNEFIKLRSHSPSKNLLTEIYRQIRDKLKIPQI